MKLADGSIQQRARARHRRNGHARRLPLALAAAVCLAQAMPALADDADDARRVQELDAVKVSAKGVSARQAAQADVDAVPGGAALIDQQRVEDGRVATSQDVLAYQPGVYALAAGGADGLKINIRGSGINRGTNYFRSGIYFLFDGLPVSGPSGSPFELFEPLGLAYTEVLKGANGFDLGSLALGGAINYVTQTGREAAPLQLRYELGSFGYQKRQLSSGQTLGDFDYFVSLTDGRSHGYQDHSASRSHGVAGNVGWQVTPDLETRLYLRYRESKFDNAGSVSLAQALHDPRAASTSALSYDWNRNHPGSTWIGSKTTWRIDDAQSLEFGLTYHDYPLTTNWWVVHETWAFRDVSATLNYTRRGQWLGRDSLTRIGLVSTYNLDSSSHSYSNSEADTGYALGTLRSARKYDGSSDSVLHASNELALRPALWLTTGLSLLYTERKAQITYPITDETQPAYARGRWDYAPRLGLRWEPRAGLQFYGNLSRSVETPNAWAMVGGNYFSSGVATSLASGVMDLRNQTATTLEIGSRGEAALGQWDVSLYRAAVRHELLSVVIADSNGAAVTEETNASATTHQGVEAALHSRLWEGAGGQRLSLRQAYSFSDFHYDHDAVFGSNRLPGIPRHYYQGELRYDHPAGWYATANTWIGSPISIDYADSKRTPGYAIYGASLGFEAPSGRWSAWLDLRNLTGKRYVAIVAPGYDDAGSDQARVTPGEGRALYAGFSWKL
ncbi:MAG: TonB-dependent receptor [Pseudomonas sp.]